MKKRIKLQRTFAATLDLVWELWTTKDGIESWWGPPGFEVTVSKLELRGILNHGLGDNVVFRVKGNLAFASANLTCVETHG